VTEGSGCIGGWNGLAALSAVSGVIAPTIVDKSGEGAAGAQGAAVEEALVLVGVGVGVGGFRMLAVTSAAWGCVPVGGGDGLDNAIPPRAVRVVAECPRRDRRGVLSDRGR